MLLVRKKHSWCYMFKTILHKIVIALISTALVFAPVTVYAVSMQQMFTGVVNTTPPGAYEGQTQNVYTGGSMAMRIPQKNYQLMSFAPPSISGGCGGINIFGGSFSFINAQQFVDMLKNIGSAALSEAFFMAIDSLSPMVGVNLKQLMDKLQKATNQSINSCEKGKELAHSLLQGSADQLKANSEKIGVEMDASLNKYTDWLATKEVDKNDTNKTQIANAAAASAGLSQQGNLVWEALAEQNAIGTAGTDNLITEFEARLIMSIVGTVIVTNKTLPAGDTTTVALELEPKPGLITASNLSNLIGIDTTTTLTGFQIYTCTDGDAKQNNSFATSTNPDPLRSKPPALLQCLYMKTTPVESATGGGAAYKSMLTLVKERMTAIQDALIADTPISALDKNFINSTSVPVYKMIAVSTAFKNSTLSTTLISQNERVIAAEYSTAYYLNLLDILTTALTKYQLKAGGQYIAASKTITDNIHVIRTELGRQLMKEYQQQQSMQTLADQIMGMEKALIGGLPNTLSGSMSMRRLTH